MVIGILGLSTRTLTHLLDIWGYPIVTLFVAIESSGEADFANEVLSAMRFEFGGHHEKKA